MNCPQCQIVLPDNAISCPYCRSRFGTPPAGYDELNAQALRHIFPQDVHVLPHNVTPLSIIAGYLALFLVLAIPFFLCLLCLLPPNNWGYPLFLVLVIPAPIALICGILALRNINKRRKNGEKIGGRGRAGFAIIIGGMITAGVALYILSACLGMGGW